MYIVLILALQALPALGQSGIEKAVDLMIGADSVVLISHVTTIENHEKTEGLEVSNGIIRDSKGIILPSFFSGQDVNSAIIIQRMILSKSDILALVKIFRKPVKKTNIGYVSLCFEPHHAILIYSKGKLSYIEICFHCNALVTSLNLNISNTDFGNGKWDEMKAFFIQYGLTYQMEGNQ